MSRDSKPPSALPTRAEILLRELPVAQRSEQVWEAQAQAIISKLQTVERGSTANELLAAPFPERLSEPPTEASAPKPILPRASRRPPHLATRAEKRAGPSVTWLLTGVVGLAAAGLLIVRVRRPAAEKILRDEPATMTEVRTPVAAAASPQPALVPAPIALAERPAELVPLRSKGGAPTKRPSSGLRLSERASARATASPEKESSSLDTLEPNPKLKPADGRQPIAERPSQGAVAAALSPVASGARACLRGRKEAVPVELEFGSDGRVQAVLIRQSALPEAATRCIQTALGKARLEPFAKPTWMVRHTVRPP